MQILCIQTRTHTHTHTHIYSHIFLLPFRIKSLGKKGKQYEVKQRRTETICKMTDFKINVL